ncbi:class I SAM-dependent methyltransferase [Nonomuraea sp. PA05]|uniref:class I SAM-dependent methyltransferase n=1 Tax=Nonomuraea sp. PA05 TaxID=2604466 RepID=UPI0011DA2BDB|nr:class I SAM-dependent methyltransferase [Nonomuraea sp. PA05]TYB56393.1 class I SAM-dependent methyltransferase [Nonomuraea sp. PA05]
MSKRHGSYGFDAPWALTGLVLGAMALAGLAAASFTLDIFAAGLAFLFGALYTLASAASYLYTTRRGKFAVWAEELQRLRGDERLLDLGCGRGAVLLLAAERLEKGRATGVDLWRVKDQSGNAEAVTRANAEAEGVAERVELVTGDMRDLPFGDDAFDAVVSSLAVHNIQAAEGREQAVREAYRVLRPGGLMLIADFRHTADYEETLRGLGVVDVRRREAGWRFWYGGPWFGTCFLEARKPAA